MTTDFIKTILNTSDLDIVDVVKKEDTDDFYFVTFDNMTNEHVLSIRVEVHKSVLDKFKIVY